jgi:hypothetical protein
MKRRDLERRLRMAGCLLKREGASHSIWINPATGVKEAVPRHNEITGVGLVGSRRVLGGMSTDGVGDLSLAAGAGDPGGVAAGAGVGPRRPRRPAGELRSSPELRGCGWLGLRYHDEQL